MSKRMKWLIAVIVVALTGFGFYAYWLNGERYKELVIAGGAPCSCDTFFLPAKIVSTDTSFGNNVSIRVAVTTDNNEADTMDLRRQPPYHAVTKEDYVTSGIRLGDSIQCTFYKRKTGDCSPKVCWFSWKRFTRALPAANHFKKATVAGPSY